MSTITIPKKLAQNDDLIVLPRKEYEELLERQVPVVKMTIAEKRDWERAKKDYSRKSYVTLEEFKNELDRPHKRKN